MDSYLDNLHKSSSAVFDENAEKQCENFDQLSLPFDQLGDDIMNVSSFFRFFFEYFLIIFVSFFILKQFQQNNPSNFMTKHSEINSHLTNLQQKFAEFKNGLDNP